MERNREPRPGRRQRPSEVLGRPGLRQGHPREEGRVREGRRQLANSLLQMIINVHHVPRVFVYKYGFRWMGVR